MIWSIVETVTTYQKGCHVEEEADLFFEAPDSGQKLQGDKIWFNTRKTTLINRTVHTDGVGCLKKQSSSISCLLVWLGF